MTDIVQQYEAILQTWVDENGFPRPPLLAQHHDNTISMATLAIPQETIYRTVMEKFMTDLTVKELIFGVDRYAKPGQGTKYKDVFTVFWWQGERLEQYGFRFGVVNYRPPPHTIVEPIDWNNTFWNDIMWKIVSSDHERMKRRIEAAKKAGHGKTVDAVIEAFNETKERIIRGEKPS